MWRCSRFACLSVNIGEFAFPLDPLGEEMDKVNDGGEEEEEQHGRMKGRMKTNDGGGEKGGGEGRSMEMEEWRDG